MVSLHKIMRTITGRTTQQGSVQLETIGEIVVSVNDKC